MSVFDREPWERDVAACPRYIGRPPAPDHPGDGATDEQLREHRDAMYQWGRDWTLFFNGEPRGGVGPLVQKGWEIRKVWPPSRAMEPHREGEGFSEAYEREQRARRDQVSAWADAFIAGNGSIGVYPEDREDMLAEVARRLREATADGFLLRALSAPATQSSNSGGAA